MSIYKINVLFIIEIIKNYFQQKLLFSWLFIQGENPQVKQHEGSCHRQ